MRLSRLLTSVNRGITQRVSSAQFGAILTAPCVGATTHRAAAPVAGLVAAIGAMAYSSTESVYAEAEEVQLGSKDPWAHTALYPQVAAHRSGSLQVSDLHSISYEVYGNPEGKPALFVHGGPGGGTYPAMARFFDPAVYRVVLVDQRGCGKSTPFAELRENTTQDSIRDFEKLRVHLGIEKWQVFGGSWGSTLALAYAV